MRLHAARGDVQACRRFLAESLRLRATAEDAKSVSYEAGDVTLVLDWTLDHSAPVAAPDPGADVVVLVDEIGAVRAVLEAHGAVFLGPAAPGAGVSCALPDGPTLVLLELSDECLMWPSAGWRTGPAAVLRAPRPRLG
ncbi:hypothetical protein Ade02nite_13580 [Paractinoplanes deccanensis]|uniref:VOC domain-containing protein n=2 Tax=Paractinoplanes deccanensis TaxID=113561 RepID=A0ABQ3XY93_9ACTN|nr:hypothetical protein Ade02nite_13580 [Actinoplanes deccanensis]